MYLPLVISLVNRWPITVLYIYILLLSQQRSKSIFPAYIGLTCSFVGFKPAKGVVFDKIGSSWHACIVSPTGTVMH